VTTTASKFWFAVAGLAFASVFVYAAFGEGEWYGSAVLGSISIAATFLGVLAVVVRDGDRADLDGAELAATHSIPAPWPALLAVGGAVAIVGLAGENPLLWVGVGIVGVVLAEWLVQGWAERATADPAFNQALRHRIMLPFEIPAVGLLVIGGVLIALSRVLLAVSENGSRVIALVVASAILAVAFVIAYRPRLSSSVLGGLLAAGAVALVAAGIAGGIAGEREVEHHEPAAEHEEESTTDSSTPAADDTTETTTSSAGH
jgi:hypothetical protein